jgi:hypothetical protein
MWWRRLIPDTIEHQLGPAIFGAVFIEYVLCFFTDFNDDLPSLLRTHKNLKRK